MGVGLFDRVGIQIVELVIVVVAGVAFLGKIAQATVVNIMGSFSCPPNPYSLNSAERTTIFPEIR
jgi:hypothetical protein